MKHRPRYCAKCDALWRNAPGRVICARKGKDCFGGIQNHHILPKSVYAKYRHDLENRIRLCEGHHSRAEDNPDEFYEWLKRARPKEYQWYLEHKDDKREVELDYEEIEIMLKAKLKDLKGGRQ